jgi:hypothetical protein
MQPLDYGRSFLIGTAPENEVRFWVESRTRIVDERTGVEEEYVQAASCKSEDTFAAAHLFYDDNYDFLPIFGPQWGIVFRRRAWLNPNYKSIVPAASLWDGMKHRLVEAADCRELTTNAEVLDATRAFLPLVAQTEVRNETTALRAVIEYPVKTMNTRRRDCIYQVDTGPVAFPDLTVRRDRAVDGISLAFVAFNAPHFADFVVEEPTPIRSGGAEGEAVAAVYHYSRLLSLPARNRLFAVTA